MARGISTNRNIGRFASCLHNEGVAFACRYYSFTTKQAEKRLTLIEAKALVSTGLQIVAVYEDGPTAASYFSSSRGEQDAKHAHAFAAAIGQTPGSAIYFAVDYDATNGDTQGVILQYFQGVKNGLTAAGAGVARFDIGVYGSGRVCSHVKETKELAKYSWLAESHGWAGHSGYSKPDIRQEIAASPLCQLAAGDHSEYEDNFAGGSFGAFTKLNASEDDGPAVPPIAPLPIVATSNYAKSVATIAEQQYQLHHEVSEGQSPLKEAIRTYWEDIGFSFPGVKTAWSAVFVSWLMHRCGATETEFKVSNAHSRFVFWAIANLRNDTGLFRAHRLEEYAPKIGDIIHNNRGDQTLTYSFAETHNAYESHSAVVVELGNDEKGRFAITVGGNESDTIGRKRVSLHADGTVAQRSLNPYICVIQNLK